MRRRAPAILAALFAATLVACAAWRMFYGIDFADEGFYVAMPYTFALGNRPFVNELALQQTAALLVTPLVRVSVALRGSEGIVLFLREVFLVLALLTATSIFRLARSLAGVPAALVVSVLPFIVVPGIASISYNSLGMNLVCAGACLAAHGVGCNNRISLVLAGPVLALASLAYPTLVLPATLSVSIAATWLAVARRAKAWRGLVYPWLAAVVLLFMWVASFGWDNVGTSLDYMVRHGIHGGDAGKATALGRAFISSAPYQPVVLLALGLVGVVTPLLRRRAWVGLALTIALLSAFLHEGDWRTISLVTFYASLFLLPGALFEAWQRCAPVATIVLLPGLVAASIAAWTSSNGFANVGIGALTSLAAVLLMALAASQPERRDVEGCDGIGPVGPIETVEPVGPVGSMGSMETTSTVRGEVLLAVACFLALIATFTFRYVYREEDLARLTARIESGPYAGLSTTPERRDFVTRLAADVAGLGEGSRVLFYDSFPAGYLFTATAPRIETTWIPYAQDFPSFSRSWYSTYYDTPQNRPDAVFEMLGVPTFGGGEIYQTSLPDDPMHHHFWRSGYRLAEVNRFYAIHRRCDQCVTDVVEAEELIQPCSREWVVIPGRYSAGRLAGTTRRGATLRSTIPRFRPGPYRVDFSLYRNTKRAHEVRITMGDAGGRLAVRRDAPFRISRATGAVFPHVRSPEFSLEVESDGKGALLIDEIAFSRAPMPELLTSDCSYCQHGPVTARPITFEPESVVTLDHASLQDRGRVKTDWIRIRRPAYSGGAAVVTSAVGATLRGRSSMLRPGDYRVSVSVIHPAAGYVAAFRLSIGGTSSIFRTDPSLPRGAHVASAMVTGVHGNEIELSLISGKPSLMIDSIVMAPLSNGRDETHVPE